MPVLKATQKYACAPEHLFNASRKLEDLARAMPNIQRVTILEQSEHRVISQWEGRIEVAGMVRALFWEEEDRWEPATLTLHFRQTKGDLKIYEGTVQISPSDAGSVAEITLHYDPGIPFLTGLLLKVVDKIVKDNANLYLKALGQVALGSGASS